jgi:hypothetical protein
MGRAVVVSEPNKVREALKSKAKEISEWLFNNTQVTVGDTFVLEQKIEDALVEATAPQPAPPCATCKGERVVQSNPSGAGHADDLAEYVPCPDCAAQPQPASTGESGAPSTVVEPSAAGSSMATASDGPTADYFAIHNMNIRNVQQFHEDVEFIHAAHIEGGIEVACREVFTRRERTAFEAGFHAQAKRGGSQNSMGSQTGLQAGAPSSEAAGQTRVEERSMASAPKWRAIASTLDHGVRKRTLMDCADEVDALAAKWRQEYPLNTDMDHGYAIHANAARPQCHRDR